MTHDFFVVVLLAAFDDRAAGAEEVSVVEAAPRHADLVDAVAAVALPEPVQGLWGWGEEGGGGFEFCRAGVGGGVVVFGG